MISLRRVLLSKRKRGKNKMNPWEFRKLNELLNYLNSFVNLSGAAPIKQDIIKLIKMLKKMVGPYRKHETIDMSLEAIADCVYREAHSIYKGGMTSAPEIEEVWNIVKSCFDEPASAPVFDANSRISTPSSLSSLSVVDGNDTDEGASTSAIDFIKQAIERDGGGSGDGGGDGDGDSDEALGVPVKKPKLN